MYTKIAMLWMIKERKGLVTTTTLSSHNPNKKGLSVEYTLFKNI